MIGLDTNVLVRYFAQDDPRQSAAASRLIERLTPENPGLVTSVVLAETVWVMEDLYAAKREQIASIVEDLLRAGCGAGLGRAVALSWWHGRFRRLSDRTDLRGSRQ